jgi:hypothetical protein
VRQLSLSGPELAEGLRDGHRLDAAAQHLVELAAAGRQPEDVAAVDRRLKAEQRPILNFDPRGKL